MLPVECFGRSAWAKCPFQGGIGWRSAWRSAVMPPVDVFGELPGRGALSGAAVAGEVPGDMPPRYPRMPPELPDLAARIVCTV